MQMRLKAKSDKIDKMIKYYFKTIEGDIDNIMTLTIVYIR